MLDRLTKSGSSWVTYTLATVSLASMAFVGFTFYRLMESASDERSWTALSAEVQVEFILFA